jgi:hypothetical protein
MSGSDGGGSTGDGSSTAGNGGMMGGGSGGTPLSAGLIDRSNFSNINGDDSGVNSSGASSAVSSHSATSSSSDANTKGTANDDSIDQITVTLVRPAAVDQPGAISVTVPEKIATSGKPFSFPVPVEVVDAAGGEVLKAMGINGKRLPTWLTYSSGTNSFSADRVPAGALPMKVLVSTSSRRWTLVITERTVR